MRAPERDDTDQFTASHRHGGARFDQPRAGLNGLVVPNDFAEPDPVGNNEMTLWRPCLHRAFPNAKISRVQAHHPLDYLRTFRNRIAHHEPIFTRHLAADYLSILTVTGWICPKTRDWIDHHSRVEDIIKTSQNYSTIKF